jgi:hypothetical protein
MPDLRQLELPFEPAPTRGPANASPRRGPIETARDPEPTTGLRRVPLSKSMLSYRFVRARRRTIGIFVIDGEVEARAPRRTPIREVEAFIREKERWIARRMAESRLKPPPFQWQDGAALPLLGNQVTLRTAALAAAIRINGNELELPPGTPEDRRRGGLAWLHEQALAHFHRRVAHYAQRLALPLPTLGLSNARTQWGSCHRKGRNGARVLLNWRLVHMPERLIDYVVAHEIAHLRELNHSARFWTVVGSVYPDHAAARRELNRLGRALPLL